ncbi:unnamed protein product [Prorocentrum cordatum]|uniref:Uncharacterized protein n=1 Tax=Prorocentrum cordatum TaxID=2364126 RepID=A0ABN9RWV1_9DINO|nr:unnamed protein product [Polarella glacialis]
MAAFTAMQPAQLLPLGVPPAASSGPAPALRGAAAGEQPQPGQGGPSVSLAAGLLAGARLIAASRPAPGRARRGARRQQLRARGGNVATELRPADVQAQANGEAKAHEFAAEARQAAKLRAEKATTEAPAGVEDNAMIASAPAGEALATGGEVAAAAAEDDEDMSSRLRFIAPLLPLAVFPLVQAKDSAKRNMDLMDLGPSFRRSD